MRQQGFTLFEVLIVIGISGLLGVVTYNFAAQGLNTWRFSSSRAQTQEQVRRAVDSIVAVTREARAGDNGAYAVMSAQASSLAFYANVDGDTAVEQVTFALNGTTLEERIVNPTGSPAQYSAAPTVMAVVNNIRSLAFQYFDKNYAGSGAPLAQPVTISAVRLVRITVSVDDDPNKQPEAVTLSNIASLRNLKDNL